MRQDRRILSLLAVLLMAELGVGAAETLAGPWRFAPGDRPEYASAEFDDSGWRQVQVPHRIDHELGAGFAGVTWYRIRVRMPEGEAALLFHGFGHAAEVYVDGRKVHSYGQVDGQPEVAWPVPRLLRVPARGAQAQIAVRVLKVAYTLHGPVFAGLLRPVRFGALDRMELEYQLVNAENQARYVIPSALGAVYLILGVLLAAVGWWSERPGYLLGIGAVIGSSGSAWTVGFSPFFRPEIYYSQLAVGFMVCGFGTAIGSSFVVTEWLRNKRMWRLGILAVLVPGFATGLFSVELSALVLLLWTVICDIAAIYLFWRLFHLTDARLGLAPLVMHAVFELAGNGFLTSFLPSITLPISYWQAIPIGRFNVYPPTIWFAAALLFSAVLGARSLLRAGQRHAEAETEMRSARAIQESLTRPVDAEIPGLQVAVCAQAAREVGGDFHQVIAGRDSALWVIAGDVSGKGLQGALWASTVIGAFRELISDCEGPAAGLRRLNRATKGLPAGMFISALMARISASGEVRFANAGHVLPYRNGQMVEGVSGLPLGVFAGAEYAENTLTLENGDRLTMLSDGLMEARNGKGDLLGFETVANWVAHGIGPEELVRRAATFGQEDDMTVVEVRRVV
jgi:hypothetical protein